MYLIDSERIRREIDGEAGRTALNIRNFEPTLLHPTHYYFRLGSRCIIKSTHNPAGEARRLSAGQHPLLLLPNELAIVTSLERFTLSERVMALFGPLSDLVLRGVELLHSPFVDPSFEGHLELALQNRSFEPVELRLAALIGKISFFDVSDSNLRPQQPDEAKQEKLRMRSEFWEDELVPGYDSPEPYSYDWRKPWDNG